MSLVEVIWLLGNVLWFAGSLSGYHRNPTEATIAYHQEFGRLPAGDVDAEYIMVAVNDCGLIGEVGRMWVEGEGWLEEEVMVFDCKGETAREWMNASGEYASWKAAAELGWNDWQEHTDWVGSGKKAILAFR